mmetsp:Transcript_20062/g.50756  ORF Transcript_20062/g.50756 Transcript_20062/m.50756 type:complete len:225 (-) Transcript_20062:134-808(-)
MGRATCSSCPATSCASTAARSATGWPCSSWSLAWASALGCLSTWGTCPSRSSRWRRPRPSRCSRCCSTTQPPRDTPARRAARTPRKAHIRYPPSRALAVRPPRARPTALSRSWWRSSVTTPSCCTAASRSASPPMAPSSGSRPTARNASSVRAPSASSGTNTACRSPRAKQADRQMTDSMRAIGNTCRYREAREESDKVCRAWLVRSGVNRGALGWTGLGRCWT